MEATNKFWERRQRSWKEAVQNARPSGGEEEEEKMRRRRTGMSVTDPCKQQSPFWRNYYRKKYSFASNGENITPPSYPFQWF